MKNLILFLSIFFTSINFCFAQKITVDRIEDDGRRQVMCSSKDEKLDGVQYSFSVKAFEKYGIIDWCLLVSSFNYISDNAILLIKLGNNEVLEIPINNLNIGTVHMPSYSYSIGNIAYHAPSSEAEYYSALFAPTELQWSNIEQYGIIKIRISSRSSYNEKVWKKDKLGKFIAKSRAKIAERLNTTRVNSIYNDF